MTERSRAVSLVVVDERGRPIGRTEARAVTPPWWHETRAVALSFPELLMPDADRPAPSDPIVWAGANTVLRLLDAEPDETGHMGGRVTYVVRADEATTERTAAAAGLTPTTIELSTDPLRLPWAEPAGPTADLAWVASVVEVTGPPTQHRTWNLSAIWSIPTAAGDRWLKCLPPFFAHEPAVLTVMADQPVPELIAADGHRLLMAELPGTDGYDASEAEQVAMVDTLVDIQLASVDRVDRLEVAGVPAMRADRLIAELSGLVARAAPESTALNRLITELPDRLATVDALRLPDVLVHGDPHSGNCRMGIDPPVWFDWGDSFIGNPLLDLGAVHRMPQAAVERWLGRWSAEVGGVDLHEAWTALEPVALLRTAWVYQMFLDNIEQTERVYHRDDVPATLARVEELLGP